MTARERTKAYNEQLKQRRAGGGGSEITTTKKSKRKSSLPAKPWQTPGRQKKKNAQEPDISVLSNNIDDHDNSNDSKLSSSNSSNSSGDQAWYDEGGFGLPPVDSSIDATALVIQVLAARDLYGVPRAPDPEPGMRDPYVSIEMLANVPDVGEKAIHLRSSIKTSVKRGTLNPKWEESLGMALPKDERLRSTSSIIIRVEDNDRFNKQNFLGCIV